MSAATMNRHARRVAASMRRPDARTPVEAYRVPAGRVALTFDLAGRDPSTISIDATALADVLDRVGKLVAGKTYEQSVHMLGAVIRAADEGVADAWNAAILGFWLAVNHPRAGAEMADRLSDAIAIDGRAHITMHANRPRGVAFALSNRFVDLDRVATRAREAGVATFVVGRTAASTPRRPGMTALAAWETGIRAVHTEAGGLLHVYVFAPSDVGALLADALMGDATAGGHAMADDLVQVGMVQTVARRLGAIPAPALLVIDECHHAVAGTWAKVAAAWPNAKVLGVTATPERLDSKKRTQADRQKATASCRQCKAGGEVFATGAGRDVCPMQDDADCLFQPRVLTERDGVLEEFVPPPAWTHGIDIRHARGWQWFQLLQHADGNPARLRQIQEARGYKPVWIRYAMQEAAEKRAAALRGAA